MRRSSWVLGAIALVLTVVGVLGIVAVTGGVNRTQADVPSSSVPGAVIPTTVLQSSASGGVPGPVVVVVHGFAGSAMLMDDLGVDLVTASKGAYTVVLPDLSGHGRNAEPLPVGGGAPSTQRLDADLDDVLAWVRLQPWADPARVALVGHSMGAGAVVRHSVGDRAVGATVALSLPSADAVPVGQPTVPRNLLLLVGAEEQPRFTDSALAALRAAYPDGVFGPGYGAPAEGSARAAEQVPRAEHITILFSADTRQQTLDWLDQTVGAPSSGHLAGGSRIGWLLLLTVGAAVGFVPIARLLLPERAGPRPSPVRPPRPWVVLLVSLGGAVLASLVACVAQPLADRVPLAVGGYVVVWFAAAALAVGLLTTVVDRRRRRTEAGTVVAPDAGTTDAPPRSPWREVVVVLGLTSYAVVALGLVGSVTWTAFAMAGERSHWLLVVELALIAWFWMDDRLVGERWWLALLTRVVAVAVLLASVVVLGAPGFLSLLVPLMAVVLGLLLVYGQTVTRRATLTWSAAVVQGVPLAYLVTTTFPLVS